MFNLMSNFSGSYQRGFRFFVSDFEINRQIFGT